MTRTGYKKKPNDQKLWLTKAELDEFDSFLYGEEIMGRNPPPSLGVVMTAERKVWRQVALMMSKDEMVTISSALKSIQDKSRFWAVETDEFCVRRQVKGHKGEGKYQYKGKVKGKYEKPGKGKGGKWGKGKLAKASAKTGQKHKGKTGAGIPGSSREIRRLHKAPPAQDPSKDATPGMGQEGVQSSKILQEVSHPSLGLQPPKYRDAALPAGELRGRREVTSLLGRLQWVAKAFPAISSHFHAWEQKLVCADVTQASWMEPILEHTTRSGA